MIFFKAVIDSASMRNFARINIVFLTIACLLTIISAPVHAAEESKNFFSWNSNFIKKSDPAKNKGIPANPPKKKIKGIPTQNTNNSADKELTDEENKTIQLMSKNLDAQETSKTLKNTVQPPIIRVPRVPKLFQVPQPPKTPRIPNLHNTRIPSPPSAFSSNSHSSSKPETPATPSK